MNKKLLMTCLAAFALSAFSVQAAPIPLYDVQYDATAIATTVDGSPGFDTQAGTSGAVSASAFSIGSTDVATAGAVAGDGLLTTSADVSSTGGIATAVATAHYAASFAGLGRGTFNFDLEGFDFLIGSGGGGTSLFVSLMSDGVTLFADYVTDDLALDFFSALGSVNVLDLTLTSEATAGFPSSEFGGATSVGIAAFAGTVPAPATLMLVLLGLGALTVIRRNGASHGRGH